MNAELVRCHEEFPVRHALGNPKTTLARGRRLHLQHPAFLPVRHQQRLAGSPQTVFVNQAAHELNRLPRRAATFQGNTPQL